jgi:hypothetical protein
MSIEASRDGPTFHQRLRLCSDSERKQGVDLAVGTGRKFFEVSASQREGSSLLSLAAANKLWIAAARRAARSEPVNSQFFLPLALGRIAFLHFDFFYNLHPASCN